MTTHILEPTHLSMSSGMVGSVTRRALPGEGGADRGVAEGWGGMSIDIPKGRSCDAIF